MHTYKKDTTIGFRPSVDWLTSQIDLDSFNLTDSWESPDQVTGTIYICSRVSKRHLHSQEAFADLISRKWLRYR